MRSSVMRNRMEGKAELMYGGKDYCYFKTPDNEMTIFYNRENGKAVFRRKNEMGMLYASKSELEEILLVTSEEFEYNMEVSESDWNDFWNYWNNKHKG